LGQILAIKSVKPGRTPQFLIVEVELSTTGAALELEIAESAAKDLAEKLTQHFFAEANPSQLRTETKIGSHLTPIWNTEPRCHHCSNTRDSEPVLHRNLRSQRASSALISAGRQRRPKPVSPDVTARGYAGLGSGARAQAKCPPARAAAAPDAAISGLRSMRLPR
jgi:hypothetical protein